MRRIVREMKEPGAYRQLRGSPLDLFLKRKRYEFLGKVPLDEAWNNGWSVCGINVADGKTRWLTEEEYASWFGGEDMAKRPALPIFAP